MGAGCSCVSAAVEVPKPTSLHNNNNNGDSDDAHAVDHAFDPVVYEMVRRSSNRYNNNATATYGQHHLLYKKGKLPLEVSEEEAGGNNNKPSTRLVLRKVKPEASTQIYAIRNSDDRPEQRPPSIAATTKQTQQQQQQQTQQPQERAPPDLTIDPYIPSSMLPEPKKDVNDWVCVSEELDIYICDTGLSHAECDQLVQTTEQVCKGHYAAYTYAKQTLGCREFPVLAHACWEPVHRVTHTIWGKFPASLKLQLDDREPHIVKYDVTKKERQKLDMHTDKSEWTFLIALSDGSGLDYEGGGTYFEALDATVHVQRGHALIFPGKLRHCGQRITKGLRFLLVGFLVDKANQASLFKDLPMSSTTTSHHHQSSMLTSGDVTVDT